MKARPYILEETDWQTVKSTAYKVAILSWGATEAHNYHLPYATDNYEAKYVANESARLAWESGAKVIVLPHIPYGVNTGQLDVKLCMNMNPSTQYVVLKDIVDVLVRHDINKLVILNGHGGNNFKMMIRELAIDFPEMFVCSLNFWGCLDPNKYFAEPGDHAGELETSIMMHLEPDLVLPLEQAGNGAAKKFKIIGLKDGWVSAQRQWTKVTKDTGVGNPSLSTAEKGKLYLKDVTAKISEFFIQLERTEIEDLYE